MYQMFRVVSLTVLQLASEREVPDICLSRSLVSSMMFLHQMLGLEVSEDAICMR